VLKINELIEVGSTNTCKLLLDHDNIMQKLKRLAYQLAEDLYGEKEIILFGIKNNGYLLAAELAKKINDIGALKVSLYALTINKKAPHNTEISIEVDIESLNNKTIVIVDDVANTGRIISYSIKPFLNILPKKLRTLALVDRKHKAFPVSVDYAGLSLATTMKEQIKVEFSKGRVNAYLC
jgi:pyrimidine operon attenuation protein/uracil phosphoribosyltransferase